jgi:2C-methyl-D-erythritol 2,4-cyclodiphosphate synthase
VGFTATSGEGLTAFGKGEGIAALVIISAKRIV